MKTNIKWFVILGVFVIILIFAIIYKISDFYSSNGSQSNQGEEEMSLYIQRVNYNSEWDSSEQYRITYFLAKAQLNLNQDDITLVVQCSRENLSYLIKLIDHWQGPVSVSVFCKAPDVMEVLHYIVKIRLCNQNVAMYVTFHLVTLEGNGNLKYMPIGLIECVSQHPKLRQDKLRYPKNYDLSVPYPVNIMRNVARKGVVTNFFLLVDIDMIPSTDLRHNFISLLGKAELDKKTVFIVPAFEIASPIPVPTTKFDLKTLVTRGVMRPFYSQLCPKCHACLHYSTWLNLPNRKGLSIAYQMSWSDPCEPFYIGRVDVPLYDERFKQYGFNRISQVCESYVAGFNFSLLDNAFLTHLGMKTKESFHSSKELEQEVNRGRFREFKEHLKFKYPKSTRHC